MLPEIRYMSHRHVWRCYLTVFASVCSDNVILIFNLGLQPSFKSHTVTQLTKILLARANKHCSG